MSGTLVYVMGPSGAGKDSLMAYARRSMNTAYALTWNTLAGARQHLRPVLFARRYITRPADAAGERHYPLTPEQFQRRQDQGGFSLSWDSHGCRYGIGAEIDTSLAQQAVVVLNGSRQYLPAAMKKYPQLLPVLVSARPEALRHRLEKRGRETSADIDERLAGACMNMPDIVGLIRLDNSGALETSGKIFAELLTCLRRARAPETDSRAVIHPWRPKHDAPALAF